ncbi:tripartite tricarboxylate transporter TctB family protein [Thalassobaculum sp.]|uniref:tripartite tricarboxylate transporter TctB family protein n=1 Tax=Thalassobaculum sp. TaxID=2022740 RepID=UPI0032EB4D54
MTQHPGEAGEGGGSPSPDRPEGRLRHRDLWLGLGILGTCAVLYYQTTTFPSVPALLSQNVQASFFPRVLIFTVGFLTLLLIAFGWHKRPDRQPAVKPVTLLTAVLTAGGIALIPWIGVLAAVGVLAVSLPLLWRDKRHAAIAAYAVLLPASIYLLFTLVMQVRFPTGLLAL